MRLLRTSGVVAIKVIAAQRLVVRRVEAEKAAAASVQAASTGLRWLKAKLLLFLYSNLKRGKKVLYCNERQCWCRNLCRCRRTWWRARPRTSPPLPEWHHQATNTIATRGRRCTMGCNSIRKYTTFGRMEWNWRRISDSMVHDFNGVASSSSGERTTNPSMLIRYCIKFIVTNRTKF